MAEAGRPRHGDPLRAEPVFVAVQLDHRLVRGVGEDRAVVQGVAPAGQVGRRRGHGARRPEDGRPCRGQRPSVIGRAGEHPGVVEPQRPEESGIELVGQGGAGDPFDGQAEQEVVGVRVRPPFARLIPRCVDRLEHLGGRPGVLGVFLDALLRGVVEHVGESAGVVEQLSDGDLAADGGHVRQVIADGVAELEPALLRELQDGRRHECLGHAADEQRLVGRQGRDPIPLPTDGAAPDELPIAHGGERDAVGAADLSGSRERRLERRRVDLGQRCRDGDGNVGRQERIDLLNAGRRRLRPIDRHRESRGLDGAQRSQGQLGREKDEEREQESGDRRTQRRKGAAAPLPPLRDRPGLSNSRLRATHHRPSGRLCSTRIRTSRPCQSAGFLLA